MTKQLKKPHRRRAKLQKPRNKELGVPTPFVTAADLSAWTGGKVSPNDPRVQPLIEGASAAIRRYCGWHIAPEKTETLLLDGSGGKVLTLQTLHLVDVASVKINGKEIPADLYDWSHLGNIELRHGTWPLRYRSVEVEFTHGFESAPDINQIVNQVCSNALASPMGATREQAGQVSVTWGQTAPNTAGGMTLLQRDLDVLDTYKLRGRW